MPSTIITLLLDKSGSMSMRKAATLEAYNAYIHSLRTDFEQNGGNPVFFTLRQFDSVALEETTVKAPITQVNLLTNESYQPRGGTPLIDAAYETIRWVEKQVQPGDLVIVAIQTDGEENQSRNYSWEALRKLISEKQEMGWQFNFMGAGIDAYKQSEMMGLRRDQTVSYNDDIASTRAVFQASAENHANFRKGFVGSTAYSSVQKANIGDKFDPSSTTKSGSSVKI
jgi:uncharacterized protein YegL